MGLELSWRIISLSVCFGAEIGRIPKAFVDAKPTNDISRGNPWTRSSWRNLVGRVTFRESCFALPWVLILGLSSLRSVMSFREEMPTFLFRDSSLLRSISRVEDGAAPFPLWGALRGRSVPTSSNQPTPPIAEIDVLWITAGLGGDGDTIAMRPLQRSRVLKMS